MKDAHRGLSVGSRLGEGISGHSHSAGTELPVEGDAYLAGKMEEILCHQLLQFVQPQDPNNKIQTIYI